MNSSRENVDVAGLKRAQVWMSEDPSGSAESLKNKFVNKMQKQIEANQRSQKDDDDDDDGDDVAAEASAGGRRGEQWLRLCANIPTTTRPHHLSALCPTPCRLIILCLFFSQKFGALRALRRRRR